MSPTGLVGLPSERPLRAILIKGEYNAPLPYLTRTVLIDPESRKGSEYIIQCLRKSRVVEISRDVRVVGQRLRLGPTSVLKTVWGADVMLFHEGHNFRCRQDHLQSATWIIC